MNPQGWPAGSYFGESLEYGGNSSLTHPRAQRNGQFGWRRGSASFAARPGFAPLESSPGNAILPNGAVAFPPSSRLPSPVLSECILGLSSLRVSANSAPLRYLYSCLLALCRCSLIPFPSYGHSFAPFQLGQRLDGLPGLLLRHSQIVKTLQIQPKLCARAKKMCQP